MDELPCGDTGPTRSQFVETKFLIKISLLNYGLNKVFIVHILNIILVGSISFHFICFCQGKLDQSKLDVSSGFACVQRFDYIQFEVHLGFRITFDLVWNANCIVDLANWAYHR